MKDFPAPLSKSEWVRRVVWSIIWTLLIRWVPKAIPKIWRCSLYRLFGAKIPLSSDIHPSARVYMPWNLSMGPWSVIGSGVNVLNPAPFTMGQNCVISERAFICCASHNIYSNAHEQIRKPISMGDRSWVAAEAFVGFGVKIGEGAVVGARAAVFKDVEPWTVVGGNPACFIKNRIIEQI